MTLIAHPYYRDQIYTAVGTMYTATRWRGSFVALNLRRIGKKRWFICWLTTEGKSLTICDVPVQLVGTDSLPGPSRPVLSPVENCDEPPSINQSIELAIAPSLLRHHLLLGHFDSVHFLAVEAVAACRFRDSR